MIFSTRNKIATEYSQGSTDVVCMWKMLHTLDCLKYWVSTSRLVLNSNPAASLHCRKGTPKWELSQNMPQRSMILHCHYVQTETRDEYRVRVSSEQEERTRAVFLLWTPVPPCQLLSPLLTRSPHAELSLVYSHSSRSSNACTSRHLVPSNILTSAPTVASLVEFKTKAAKMHSASQNGNRLRLVDTLSVLWQKIIFQGISAHNTMPGHLSTWEAGKVFPWEQ